jgi:hypothetical protein
LSVEHAAPAGFVELWAGDRCGVSIALKASPWLADAIRMKDSRAPIARWHLAAPPGASRQHGGEPLARARVLTITDRCGSCRSKVRGVVGLLVEMSAGRRFVAFADIAEQLASSADPRTLAARGIGSLRHRDSPGIPGGYTSNGCPECDALIGRLGLDDMLDEHLRNGGTYGQLDCGLALELDIPAAAQWLRRAA